MKTELCNYDIFPKVLIEGREATVTVKPLGAHAAFESGIDYTIRVLAIGDGDPTTYPARNNLREFRVAPSPDGCLRFSASFCGEQEHFIRIFRDDRRLIQLSVYSLHADMAGRYPFRGDLHMHTFRSDGREAPAIVSANYRRNGYDFFAITDHGRYYPSLEAIAAYKDVPLDFKVYPGEEIHLPGNSVHIVNFGADYSVNGLVEGLANNVDRGTDPRFRSVNGRCPDVLTADAYRRQVEEFAATLDIPAGIERFEYASCVWAFNHIKHGGGLGIFCHPYWISNVFQIPEAFTDFMMERHPFGAFEVLGGENYYEHNGYQTAKYYEDQAKGRRYPIVGSTDSHGSVNNRNSLICSTIVFAPGNSRDALVGSIKDMYSVAVDTISTEFRLVGEFRFIKYGCFLLNNYFPIHDELCVEEGRLMKDYVCGEEGAGAALRFIHGRMQKMRAKYFNV